MIMGKKWIVRAEKDLDEVIFLFKNDRPLEDGACFVHQAIEKSINSTEFLQAAVKEKLSWFDK